MKTKISVEQHINHVIQSHKIKCSLVENINDASLNLLLAQQNLYRIEHIHANPVHQLALQQAHVLIILSSHNAINRILNISLTQAIAKSVDIEAFDLDSFEFNKQEHKAA